MELSTFDVVRILRIGRSRLVHWMRGEFIPPGRDKPWGKCRKTIFSRDDLYNIALFKTCMDFGFTRKFAKMCWQDVEWNRVGEKDYEYILITKGDYLTFTVHLIEFKEIVNGIIRERR